MLERAVSRKRKEDTYAVSFSDHRTSLDLAFDYAREFGQ